MYLMLYLLATDNCYFTIPFGIHQIEQIAQIHDGWLNLTLLLMRGLEGRISWLPLCLHVAFLLQYTCIGSGWIIVECKHIFVLLDFFSKTFPWGLQNVNVLGQYFQYLLLFYCNRSCSIRGKQKSLSFYCWKLQNINYVGSIKTTYVNITLFVSQSWNFDYFFINCYK